MSGRRLQAGHLSAEFVDGNLRDIRWHGHEAIRAISYLVRDENWGNHPVARTEAEIVEDGNVFSIRYHGTTRSSTGAELSLSVEISASADGRLSFAATARPDEDFVTNRCGFCILHPIVGVAGNPATVEHVDGTVVQTQFPDLIDPAQPFFDMRRITHQVTPDVSAECRMEGDTFEMEDQRNWTDASYKTYVRPLALPWPYVIGKGESNRQRISLTLKGVPEHAAPDAAAPVTLRVGRPQGLSVPAFGLGIRPRDLAGTMARIADLHDIAPRHLILYYNPLEGHGPKELADYGRLLEAYPATATLEFVLPCKASPAEELEQAARDVATSRLALSAIAVCPAPDLKSTPPGSAWPACPPLDEVYAAARAAFPGLRLGGGMFSYFTELNRKRPPVDRLDFITHTTAPLVHAADDRSVMDTLEALPFITRSVRSFAGAKPYRIGPSAIGMRHNPYGAALNANPDGRRMTMVEHDPRQKEQFAAAWLIGYAAAVADAGLEVLTLGSLTGAFGVLDDDKPVPAFAAVKLISALSGSASRPVVSSDPARVLGLAGGDRLLITNLTPDPQTVLVDGEPVDLMPYGVASMAMGFE
jgi:hypothetical protein